MSMTDTRTKRLNQTAFKMETNTDSRPIDMSDQKIIDKNILTQFLDSANIRKSREIKVP